MGKQWQVQPCLRVELLEHGSVDDQPVPYRNDDDDDNRIVAEGLRYRTEQNRTEQSRIEIYLLPTKRGKMSIKVLVRRVSTVVFFSSHIMNPLSMSHLTKQDSETSERERENKNHTFISGEPDCTNEPGEWFCNDEAGKDLCLRGPWLQQYFIQNQDQNLRN